MKQKIKDEDKFMLCKHINDGFCDIIKHEIRSTYASIKHCGKCKKFEKIKNQMEEEK